MSYSTSLPLTQDFLPDTGDLVRGLTVPTSFQSPGPRGSQGRADLFPKVCQLLTAAPPCDVLSHLQRAQGLGLQQDL